MYMMAFVTLMVALIGAYAQIYAKLATKGFSQQSGVVDTMMTWHSTAVNLAAKRVTFSANCTLTQIGGVGVPSSYPKCNIAVEDAAVTEAQLPTGYRADPYKFYSAAYTASTGGHYVLTYVPPPPSSGDDYKIGLICLPDCAEGKRLPVTFNAFYKELRNSTSIAKTSWGVVSNSCTAPLTACLKTSTLLYDTYNATGTLVSVRQPFEYPLPAEGVPVGSIGIISEFTPHI